MLEASTRPAMVPGCWRRWPAWSPYAAVAWSVLYGALALSWAAGAPGFPFGEGDLEGAVMGWVLFAVPAEPTGLVMAGWCAAGVIMARAMRRPTSHRRGRRALLAIAWCFAITMLLVIPNIRLLQNLAYGLLFVFLKLHWAVLNQGAIVLGGILWAMTAISYRRKHAGAGTGRREAKVAANRSPALMRWSKAATYAAFVLPLPYGITRLAWALGLPLGIDQDLSGNPLTARIGEAGLAPLAIGGGIITLGLIRPWGRSGPAGSPASPAGESPSPCRPSSVEWPRWRSRWAGLPSSGSRSSAPWGWRPSRLSHPPPPDGRPGSQAGCGRSGESPSPSQPSPTTTVGTTRAGWPGSRLGQGAPC